MQSHYQENASTGQGNRLLSHVDYLSCNLGCTKVQISTQFESHQLDGDDDREPVQRAVIIGLHHHMVRRSDFYNERHLTQPSVQLAIYKRF